jgi:hypothetical protein
MEVGGRVSFTLPVVSLAVTICQASTRRLYPSHCARRGANIPVHLPGIEPSFIGRLFAIVRISWEGRFVRPVRPDESRRAHFTQPCARQHRSPGQPQNRSSMNMRLIVDIHRGSLLKRKLGLRTGSGAALK